MKDEILAAAQEYKNYNWKVVPIDSKTRAPITGAYAKSYKDLETPTECLNCFGWSSQAFQTLAKIIEPDEIVIDTDTPEWLDCAWPVTPTVVTPRGLHLHFKRPSDLKMGQASINCGDGFEVKAGGMLSNLPPGKHSSGAVYTWKHDHKTPMADLPQWCIDKINAYLERTRSGQVNMKEEELNRLLAGVGKGERNHACMKIGGHLIAKGLSFDDIEKQLVSWNKLNQPPMPLPEIHECIKSLRRYHEQHQEKKTNPYQWIASKREGELPHDAKMPSKVLADFAVLKGLCKPEDITDGWRLPPDVFNQALWTADVNLGHATLRAENQAEAKKLVKARDGLTDLKEELKDQGPESKRRGVIDYFTRHCKGCELSNVMPLVHTITAQLGGLASSEANRIDKDIEKALDKAKPKGKAAREEPEEPPANPEIVAKAEEIMKSGDPVEFIIDTHQHMHVGDIEISKTLLVSIGSQSCLNSDGIQPKLNGSSGKGKSHCAQAMAHMIPKKYLLKTSLSSKALYYKAPELPDGVVIFCDDASLSDDMQSLIKRATTDFQEGTTHTSVSKDLTINEMRTPKRVSWWLTSVDDSESIQLLNRQFGGGVDESPDQDERVAAHQLRAAAVGLPEYPITVEVLTCREIIKAVKGKLFTVLIPYAEAIVWNDKSNRRNLPIFLDIIRSYAVLRFMQRRYTKTGLLIADIQDYEDAKSLYVGRAEKQGLKLTNQERQICFFLSKKGAATREEIAVGIGATPSRISQLMHGPSGRDCGLMHKIGIEKDETTETTTTGDMDNKQSHSVRVTKFRLTDGFNKLGMFDSVVSLDTSMLNSVDDGLSYTELCDSYIIVNNKINNSSEPVMPVMSIENIDIKESETLGSDLPQNKRSDFLSLSLKSEKGITDITQPLPMRKGDITQRISDDVTPAGEPQQISNKGHNSGLEKTETYNESCIRKLLESAEIQVVQPEDADRIIAEMLESKE